MLSSMVICLRCYFQIVILVRFLFDLVCGFSGWFLVSEANVEGILHVLVFRVDNFIPMAAGKIVISGLLGIIFSFILDDPINTVSVEP